MIKYSDQIREYKMWPTKNGFKNEKEALINRALKRIHYDCLDQENYYR